MRQLTGYAMSAIIMLTVAYAFAPRSPAPLAATVLHTDRLQINDLLANDQQLVAVGERGSILLSDDDGLSWQQAHVPQPSDVTLTGVVGLSSQVLLAVGDDGWILRSQDAGKNWQRVRYDAELAEPLLGVWAGDEQRVVAFGSNGKYLESSNGGLDWSPREVSLDGLHLNGMDGGDDGRQMLVGEQGLVMRSVDRGLSWEGLPAFYNGSLFGVARLSAERWVVYGMRGHLFVTQDFGLSWKQIELGNNLPLFGHVRLPDNAGLVIVGADSTLVRLDAQGALQGSTRRPGLGTLTSAAVVDGRNVLVAGERGVLQSAPGNLVAAGHREAGNEAE
ncbi:YCF48-related protein [Pseudomonas sp. R5(2019)]|uniref:WD40/YVTN/BNR-like repeat-containing protein n=1 Tax=Pseudomonas sp. R5(2019) TaxID=2697566 RepID=UPI001412D015|nr:YCF48-related protein [Pseudomonas sp. R5(2019)]NBA98648.1 glycosyl hydrolase [Pseudomonas sp. R5(2019)]